MDRLRTMSVFVAVAEEGGFASAARRLAMSPPSVTRAVSDLEHLLKARLFHRTTRTVRLTEAGQRYLGDCRRILADLAEADRHVAGLHADPSGMVTVTASTTFGRMALVPVVLDLIDRYADIRVSTLFVDRVVHLVEEGIDVAVRIADLPDSSLTAIRVGSVRHVLCATPAYLKRRGAPIVPQDLQNHDLINFTHFSAGDRWDFVQDGKARQISIQPLFNLNTADAAIAAALAGRGITNVFSYMVESEVAAGQLELVLDEFQVPPVPVHVMHKEAGQTSARVRAVVDFFVERLRALPALKPSDPAPGGK